MCTVIFPPEGAEAELSWGWVSGEHAFLLLYGLSRGQALWCSLPASPGSQRAVPCLSHRHPLCRWGSEPKIEQATALVGKHMGKSGLREEQM